MAKYAFKIYLNNGDSIEVVPRIMKNTDLSDMDKFASNCGNYYYFLTSLANEFNISREDIIKVSILRLKKKVEFSIVVSNPYLEPVLSDLVTKKVLDLRDNEIETTVVPTSHPNYIEMKEYLFNNIKNNFEFFLDNIYTYDNEFQRLLIKYDQASKIEFSSLEEVNNLENLERKIKTELSIYKNYRGLCVARRKYDKKVQNDNDDTKDKKISNVSVSYTFPSSNIELEVLSKEDIERINKQNSINKLNNFTNDLGEEKEEFLELDELENEKYYR